MDDDGVRHNQYGSTLSSRLHSYGDCRSRPPVRCLVRSRRPLARLFCRVGRFAAVPSFVGGECVCVCLCGLEVVTPSCRLELVSPWYGVWRQASWVYDASGFLDNSHLVPVLLVIAEVLAPVNGAQLEDAASPLAALPPRRPSPPSPRVVLCCSVSENSKF